MSSSPSSVTIILYPALRGSKYLYYSGLYGEKLKDTRISNRYWLILMVFMNRVLTYLYCKI